MSPIPLECVPSGPGTLAIGTTVRETAFQPSFSLNGMTGWALSSKKP